VDHPSRRVCPGRAVVFQPGDHAAQCHQKQSAQRQRKQDADEAWLAFSGNDVENVAFMITPQLGGYFR